MRFRPEAFKLEYTVHQTWENEAMKYPLAPTLLRRSTPMLGLACLLSLLPGCTVLGAAASVASTAISVTGSVVSTGVSVTGKVVEKAIDVAVPDDKP